MKVSLGSLRRVPPKDIWPSESRDFTPWLSQNMNLLGDAVGLDLELLETEASVGEFAVDILARDLATSREVVVENQFGPTNHDHLGKLLTYASGVGAYALVWIAEEIRDEHRQALEWLNERTDEDTFLFALEIEVLQIDESAPAFNLKPIVVPNKWQKTARSASRTSPSPRGEAYKAFFQALIDELRDKHRFTGARVAFAQNWYSFASGMNGIAYGASFAQGNRVRIDLYIDRADADENKRIFDWLMQKKNELETRLDTPLEWERLDDRRASRVATYRPGSIEVDEATLAEIRAWIIKQLLAFREAFNLPLRAHLK